MEISTRVLLRPKNIQKKSAEEILMKALRGDAAMGIDDVAKAFIQIKKRK